MNKNHLFKLLVSSLLCTLPAIGTALELPADFRARITMQQVTVGEGRHLYTATKLSKPSDPWLVYMPGSGDQLNPLSKLESVKILTAHHDYNILIINKVGIELDNSVNKDEFQHGSIRSQRIADNLQVLQEFVPADASILLVSLSEGAYISPEVAQADSRVKALILLSGNSWSWLEEEVMWLAPEQRQARRDFLENVVVPNPVFDKFYGDDNFWSYAYFDSYNTDKTYRTLENLTLPILALNGEKDDTLWLEGALENLSKLVDVEGKTNIEKHLIPGANHGLKCPEKTDCDQAAMSQLLKELLENFSDRTL